MDELACLVRARGLESVAASRGDRFSDSIILVNAAGLGLALARAPHIEGYLARGSANLVISRYACALRGCNGKVS